MLASPVPPAVSDDAPPGWQLEEHGLGFFETGADHTESAEGRNAAFIRSKSMDKPAKAEAELVQRVDATPYVAAELGWVVYGALKLDEVDETNVPTDERIRDRYLHNVVVRSQNVRMLNAI